MYASSRTMDALGLPGLAGFVLVLLDCMFLFFLGLLNCFLAVYDKVFFLPVEFFSTRV